VSIELKPHAYDPFANPELFEGVLSRRVIAFVIDVALICLPVLFLAVLIFIFGVITLGFGWILYVLLYPAAVVWALLYYGFTFGQQASANIGLLVRDLDMRTSSASPASFVTGFGHAIVYWISVPFLTPLILLVGVFNERGRLLHHILVGTVVINNPARAQSLRSQFLHATQRCA